jgi:small-conductance mechanosensitive channel
VPADAAATRLALGPELALAAGAALALHALLRRFERRLPLWLARRTAAEPGAAAAALVRYRRPIGQALLLPKAALWLAVAGLAVEQVMPLAAARDALEATLRATLMAPLLEAGGRRWSVLDLLELPLLLVAVWLGVSLLARWLRGQLVRAGGMEGGAGDTVATLARYGLTLLGSLVVLQAWGFDVRSLALLGGVVGVGLGFGLQNIANNFVSGLLLSFERPIKAGDFVSVGSFSGVVQRIGARSTEIRTRDHVTILVPNARFLESEVVNWSHGSPVSRLHVRVGVAYGSDVGAVRAALLDAARSHPLVLADPRPAVELRGFGESSLDFELLVWTREPALHPTTHSELNFRIEANLRRRGVTVPFPQRDLHLRSPELVRLLEAWARHALPGFEPGEAAAPAPAAPAAADPAPEEWSDEALRGLVERMRGPDGVAIEDRRYRLSIHRRCFVGGEAVQWLVAREGLTRAEARALGERLVERGLAHHVLDEHGFEDGHLFYRFYADETSAGGR